MNRQIAPPVVGLKIVQTFRRNCFAYGEMAIEGNRRYQKRLTDSQSFVTKITCHKWIDRLRHPLLDWKSSNHSDGIVSPTKSRPDGRRVGRSATPTYASRSDCRFIILRSPQWSDWFLPSAPAREEQYRQSPRSTWEYPLFHAYPLVPHTSTQTNCNPAPRYPHWGRS